MKRRDFLKGSAAAAAVVAWPINISLLDVEPEKKGEHFEKELEKQVTEKHLEGNYEWMTKRIFDRVDTIAGRDKYIIESVAVRKDSLVMCLIDKRDIGMEAYVGIARDGLSNRLIYSSVVDAKGLREWSSTHLTSRP